LGGTAQVITAGGRIHTGKNLVGQGLAQAVAGFYVNYSRVLGAQGGLGGTAQVITAGSRIYTGTSQLVVAGQGIVQAVAGFMGLSKD